MNYGEIEDFLNSLEVGTNIMSSGDGNWVFVKRPDGDWTEMEIDYQFSQMSMANRLESWDKYGVGWAVY